MTGHKNKPGAGRPPAPPGTKRHNIMLPPDVWDYLNQNGSASAEISRIVRKEREMNSKPTYEQIAKSFDLWGEYVDPQATMTREQFDKMSVEEKVELQEEMYGKE